MQNDADEASFIHIAIRINYICNNAEAWRYPSLIYIFIIKRYEAILISEE